MDLSFSGSGTLHCLLPLPRIESFLRRRNIEKPMRNHGKKWKNLSLSRSGTRKDNAEPSRSLSLSFSLHLAWFTTFHNNMGLWDTRNNWLPNECHGERRQRMEVMEARRRFL